MLTKLTTTVITVKNNNNNPKVLFLFLLLHERNFPVLLFVMLYKVVLTQFESRIFFKTKFGNSSNFELPLCRY